jgi:hypothetical protein
MIGSMTAPAKPASAKQSIQLLRPELKIGIWCNEPKEAKAKHRDLKVRAPAHARKQ